MVEPVPPPPPPDKFLESFIAVTATNYFDASFNGLPLSVAVTRFAFYSEFKFRLSPEWMLKIFPYADFSLYSFQSDFGSSSPPPFFTGSLRDAYLLSVDATLAYKFAPGWAIVGGGRLTSSAATNAILTDSITGGGIIALKKSLLNNGVDFTFGISYTSRLSRSWQVQPYFDFDVNVLPSFVKIPVNIRLLYNGALLSYRVTDNLALSLQGRYDARSYRLRSFYHAVNGSELFRKAVWNESGLELGGGFTFAPRRKNWALSVTGGVEILRNVQIITNSGGQFFDFDVSPTPFVSGAFHAAF